MNTNYQRFLVHTGFQWFSASLFNVFGVLLFYKLTGSVFGALLFYVIYNLSLVLIRSFGVPMLLRCINRIGLVRVMILGLSLKTISYVIFAFIAISNSALPLLFVFAIVHAAGSVLYWTPSNTLLFGFIGESATPGQSTAYVSIVRTTSGIVASVLGLILGLTFDNFLLLFVAAAAALLLSMIPLLGVTQSIQVKVVSVWTCMRKLSPAAFYSNLDGSRTLIELAIPLIILASFGSLTISIEVSALVAVVTVISAYFSGFLKDRKNNILCAAAFLGIICVWIGYSFIYTLPQFVALGVMYGILVHVISVCSDARLGREAVNSKDILETTIAIELTRGLGALISVIILFTLYTITASVPQTILLLGILFTIPRGLYALGIIAKLK